MHLKNELKELEGLFKKFDQNLFIWFLIELFHNFETECYDYLNKNLSSSESTFNTLINMLKDCEDLNQVKSKSLFFFSKLDLDHNTKQNFLNNVIYDPPNTSLTRHLKMIQTDRRLADFIFFNINEGGYILKYAEAPMDLEGLIETNNNKNIFYKDELINFYSNNSAILVNLYIAFKFSTGKPYEERFYDLIKEFESIKKLSKTVIGKNIENDIFFEWLYNYIEKNIINNNEITYNIKYTPHTVKEKKNLLLHQLDVWAILDSKRYATVLAKIQSAWHKKTHDDRKRKAKLKG